MVIYAGTGFEKSLCFKLYNNENWGYSSYNNTHYNIDEKLGYNNASLKY